MNRLLSHLMVNKSENIIAISLKKRQKMTQKEKNEPKNECSWISISKIQKLVSRCGEWYRCSLKIHFKLQNQTNGATRKQNVFLNVFFFNNKSKAGFLFSQILLQNFSPIVSWLLLCAANSYFFCAADIKSLAVAMDAIFPFLNGLRSTALDRPYELLGQIELSIGFMHILIELLLPLLQPPLFHFTFLYFLLFCFFFSCLSFFLLVAPCSSYFLLFADSVCAICAVCAA